MPRRIMDILEGNPGGGKKGNPVRERCEMLHSQPQQGGKSLKSTTLEELEGASGKQHIAKIL